MNRKYIFILAALVILLMAFVPPFQGVQRFQNIITNRLTVSNDATINNLTLTGSLDLQGGEVITNAFENMIIAAPTDIATAVPALNLDTEGGASVAVRIARLDSDVLVVENSGKINQIAGGASFVPNVIVAAPTSVGTATPVAMVNTAGGVSNLFEARAASTPQVIIGPAGAVTFNQAVTANGAVTENAGSTNNTWVKVAAPTAIATATPAAVIDSAGVSNLLEVRKAATPVFSVGNAGAVTGLVLQYGTAGQKLVAGSDLITGTAEVDTGLTTVTFALCTLGEDPESGAGDAAMCTVAVAANAVTVNVWQDDFVTPATEVDVVVHWLAVGAP